MAGPKLTAYTPIFNEVFFAPLWLENVKQFADEIVILDTGSTDGTLDILKSDDDERIKLLEYPHPVSSPFEWNEGHARNYGLEYCTGDYVLFTDSDEIVSDNFATRFEEITADGKINTFGFNFIYLWGDIRTMRMNGNGEECWNIMLRRMLKREHLSWRDQRRHSPAAHIHPVGAYEDITIFHLHYGLGSRSKKNDNRWHEISHPNPFGYTVDESVPRDYTASGKLEVILQPHGLELPNCIKRYERALDRKADNK